MRKPNVSYFKVFGCKCFVLNTKDNLGKFDAISLKPYLLGIQILVRPIDSSIDLLWLLKNTYMSSLRNLILLWRMYRDWFLRGRHGKLTLKDSPIEEENSKVDVQGEVQEVEVEPT